MVSVCGKDKIKVTLCHKAKIFDNIILLILISVNTANSVPKAIKHNHIFIVNIFCNKDIL